MKKIAIALLLTISCSSLAQWEVLNEGFNLYNIEFVNNKTGWTTGAENRLMRTTDGGINWEIITLNKEWTINSVDFLDDSTGWGTGGKTGGAIIIKTTDGGHNWFIQKEIPEVWFNITHIIDEENVYVAAMNAIYKTSDGGTTWTDVTPKLPGSRLFNSMWFPNADTGIVAGNFYDDINQYCMVLKTTNGGVKWEEVKINEFSTIYELQMTGDSTGYFKAYKDTMTYLYYTNDMLSSWTKRTETRWWIGSYQFVDTSTGYAIMGDNTSSNNIMKTTNGGLTWFKLTYPKISQRLTFQKIFFNKDNTGFLIGGQGTIFKSTNGGDDWLLTKHAYTFLSSSFYDLNKGILFGGFYSGFHDTWPSGDIFTTSDGGKTLNSRFSTYDVFEASETINDSIMLASGKSIYKTTDGGSSWDIKYTVHSDPVGPMFGKDINTIKDLQFIGQNGWAVGREWDSSLKAGKALILRTTDTGETWKEVWSSIDSVNQPWRFLTSICMNETSGWAVGVPGLIVQYTSKKGWILQKPLTDLPLNKVVSRDSIVWMSGGYSAEQSIFLKSTDNGETWKKDQSIQYVINDFYFMNNTLGWAVGLNKDYRGVILKSTNGGDTWEVKVNELAGPLKSIYVRGNYAWAVGERGLVIRTTNAGLTWIDDKNNVYPSEFRLEQNYPNPFNPSTIIRWQTPEAGKVKITVYDALGKQVAVLINEEQPAGLHQTTFNGTNLPSGVYYYQLQTGTFTESKKMLIIK